MCCETSGTYDKESREKSKSKDNVQSVQHLSSCLFCVNVCIINICAETSHYEGLDVKNTLLTANISCSYKLRTCSLAIIPTIHFSRPQTFNLSLHLEFTWCNTENILFYILVAITAWLNTPRKISIPQRFLKIVSGSKKKDNIFFETSVNNFVCQNSDSMLMNNKEHKKMNRVFCGISWLPYPVDDFPFP